MYLGSGERVLRGREGLRWKEEMRIGMTKKSRRRTKIQGSQS